MSLPKVFVLSNRKDIIQFCKNNLRSFFEIEAVSWRILNSVHKIERLIVDISLFFCDADIETFLQRFDCVTKIIAIYPIGASKANLNFFRNLNFKIIYVPCEMDFFKNKIKNIFQYEKSYEQDEYDTDTLLKLKKFIGKSKAICKVKNRVAKIACSNNSVLFEGESGTGKSFMAQLLHEISDRRDKKFVRINSNDLKNELALSDLYGTTVGAYTGAVSKNGHFTIANGGTIFFDEIENMHLSIQKTLLTVLDSGVFYKVGSPFAQKVDVRIISATNISTTEMISQGDFRKDLFNRIADSIVRIPPLRERLEDVPEIFDDILIKNKCLINLSDDAKDFMTNFDWPGNIYDLIRLAKFLKIHFNEKTVYACDIADWTEENCLSY